MQDLIALLATILLYANSVWDLCCAASILLNIPPLNSIHTSLWKEEGERNNRNPTADRLMAYLILVWGGMRFAGAAGKTEWACVSFLIEGAVFASEVLLFGTMHAGQGMAVSLSSFALAACFWAL